MKKYLSIIALAALTACSNEENVPSGPRPIRLTSALSSMTRINALDVQSTQIQAGQKVGVTIRGGQTPHENMSWRVGANGELTNTKEPIYWDESAIQIYAYHPHNGNSGETYDEYSEMSFSVQKDQSGEGYMNSDLMWAATTSDVTDEAITLNFEHRLAKINIVLENNDKSDVDLTNSTITLTKVNTTINFTYLNGELNWDHNRSDILAGTNTMQAAAIIVPQEMDANQKFIRVEVQDKIYYYTLKDRVRFESGKEYTFKLTIKGTVLISLSETVKNWTDGGTTEGNLVEYMDPVKNSKIPFDATLTELTYSGELTGNEIYVLRKMLGAEEFEESERGQLQTLDISEAHIVEGGTHYLEDDNSSYSRDNIIGQRMFWCCRNLKSIKLPNSVLQIENNAFYGCENLSTITLPENLEKVFFNSFANTRITNLTLPETMKEIHDRAFANMRMLSSINIPDGVTHVGVCIFENSAMPEIIMSENQKALTRDAYGVLYNKDMTRLHYSTNKDLTEYQIPESVTEIGSEAFRRSKITSIIIPDGVENMGEGVFLDSDLSSVRLSSNLWEIGDDTFAGTKITSITIPENIEWIGGRSFKKVALTEMHCKGTNPPQLRWDWAGSDNTYKISPDAILYVPAESVEAYQNSDWANYFTNIVAEEAAQ